MANYPQRFQRVLDYIDAHIQDPLSAEQLSEVAQLSRYHFHRQFSALYGVTLFGYITAARLKRAAYQLAFRPKMRVIDIALDNGYDSSEAFSRAFRTHFGRTPSQFRQLPDWPALQDKQCEITKRRDQFMQTQFSEDAVEFIEFPRLRLGVYEHRGTPETLGDSIRAFIAWRREYGATPDNSRTFNILYDDPATTPTSDYRFDLGAEVDKPVPDNRCGIVNKSIPAGPCVRLRVTGSDDKLGAALDWLYREWLPASGRELQDFPLFLERVRFYPDVPPQQMITDIFLLLLE